MRRLFLGAAVLAVALSGCSGESDAASGAGEMPVVFAASSLNAVLPQIADASYSFDGSSGLLDQLTGGAPADVFASADEQTMDKAVEAGLVESNQVLFATNHLVLVAPADNPAGVTGLDDSLSDAKLVICAPEVPCGAATERLSTARGVTLAPVSEETKVTDVLGKVTAGEADAGIVYATDAASAGDEVVTFELPGAASDPNTYWIAVLAESPHPDAAREYVSAVTGEKGREILADAGFGPAS